MLAVATLNVVFAFYLYIRYSRMRNEEASSWRASWKLFAYDVGVYIYLWIFLFQIVWLIIGGVWYGDVMNNIECRLWRPSFNLVVILIAVYVACSLPILFCSAIVEMCCRSHHDVPPQPHPSTAQPPLGQDYPYAPQAQFAPQYQQGYNGVAYGAPQIAKPVIVIQQPRPQGGLIGFAKDMVGLRI